MKYIKSKDIYTPVEFVARLTGEYYVFTENDIASEIHNLLRYNGIENDTHTLRDYPLDEIDEIVRNEIPVVLVSIPYVDDNLEIKSEGRWFEVPKGFEEERVDEMV